VKPPNKKGAEGDAPVKACPECNELLHISAKQCPACGYVFPVVEKPAPTLHNDDIMGLQGTDMAVQAWQWRKHISRTSGKEMLMVTYYGRLSDPPVKEYFPVTHGGIAGQRAIASVAGIMRQAKAMNADSLEGAAEALTVATPPDEIEYKREGKSLFNVIRREWA
jgi:DNA repair protein RadD